MSRISIAEKHKQLLINNKPENLDKLDRFRAFYLSEIELTQEENETLIKMRKAFSYYSNFPSNKETIKILMKELLLSESQCYLLLRNSKKLFGDIEKVDKAGERAAAYEYYMLLSKLAKENEDYETAMRCKEKADKLIGLFDSDRDQVPLHVLFPATVFEFISDIKILIKQAEEEKESDYTLLDE